MRVIPFAGMHVACAAVIWVGVSPIALAVCVGLYLLRMFAITAGYHRYFSHRTFKTSRVGQFLFAFIGASAAQRGPLWWAAHHRVHHQYSDLDGDVHSPTKKGFFYSHVGWVLSREHFGTKIERVKDLARFPELRFLDRFDIFVPTSLGIGMFFFGWILEAYAPSLGTTKWQMLIWGFVISTVALYHATFTINSLSHLWGFRRFPTRDTSRNNPLLALITLGEGWHNNHHFYPGSVRQGFRWYEYDLSFYALKFLSFFGLVWDLRPVPANVWERTIERQRQADDAKAG
ncbi:MAG: acyl-CoA desaturase [Planctomycetota bacterium]